MAFSARRSLASGLSRHLTRRLHPSLPHLVSSHHDRSEDPSCSSAPPSPTQQPSRFPFTDLRRCSRSQNLTLPLPFGYHLGNHRNFSTTSSSEDEILSNAAAGQMDVAAGVLSDAASSVVPSFPAPFPGEVAAAAVDSSLLVAAMQHLIDAVHSFTGLNWWASIALMTVLVRTATIPLMVHQLKYNVILNWALKPQIEAIDKDMSDIMDPRSRQERDKKLSELFSKHGVSRWVPFKLFFIEVPIFISLIYALENMIEKVPSLKGGGAYWFTDLTTPDELYILPVLTSMVYAAAEPNIKARLAGRPMQTQKNMKNFHRVVSILSIPLSMSFCKAHFFYWLPWTVFSVAYGYAVRMPTVMQYLNLPLVVPQPSPAAQAPTSKGPKPVPAVDSTAAVIGSEQSSSKPKDESVDAETKKRTPSVITSRVQE